MPCHPHAALCRGLEKVLQIGMVVAWHMFGIACVNQTQPGRRTAWEWHGMCELAFRVPAKQMFYFFP
jgi:hypothetical protein